MRREKFLFLLMFIIGSIHFVNAQQVLKPGFDPKEYRQMLEITARQIDTPWTNHYLPAPKDYHLAYRSPEVGLLNRWDLWMGQDSVAVISIRGTVQQSASWIENFYSAMVPAIGKLKLNDSTTFHYQLADDSAAAVHVGWLLGLAYLSPTILTQIHQYYQQGIKNFIIMGHSQGGALAFLLRSYLYYLPDSVLPKDIIFKTYCSAAPKPGNLQYAYDFNRITRGGWALHVVNAKDWVPQTPVSVQTLPDMSKPNPFLNVKSALKKQPFFIRLYTSHAFRRIIHTLHKAQQVQQKYFGKTAFKQVHKILPGFKEPAYAPTNNYTPAGTPVVLLTYPAYFKDFPQNKNVFVNHSLKAYWRLLNYNYGK